MKPFPARSRKKSSKSRYEPAARLFRRRGGQSLLPNRLRSGPPNRQPHHSAPSVGPALDRSQSPRNRQGYTSRPHPRGGTHQGTIQPIALISAQPRMSGGTTKRLECACLSTALGARDRKSANERPERGSLFVVSLKHKTINRNAKT